MNLLHNEGLSIYDDETGEYVFDIKGIVEKMKAGVFKKIRNCGLKSENEIRLFVNLPARTASGYKAAPMKKPTRLEKYLATQIRNSLKIAMEDVTEIADQQVANEILANCHTVLYCEPDPAVHLDYDKPGGAFKRPLSEMFDSFLEVTDGSGDSDLRSLDRMASLLEIAAKEMREQIERIKKE